MSFIGDWRCKYNAHSPSLRCAINPCGPCEGCKHFVESSLAETDKRRFTEKLEKSGILGILLKYEFKEYEVETFSDTLLINIDGIPRATAGISVFYKGLKIDIQDAKSYGLQIIGLSRSDFTETDESLLLLNSIIDKIDNMSFWSLCLKKIGL